MKKFFKKIGDSVYNFINNGGIYTIIAIGVCGIIISLIGLVLVHPMEIWAFALDFALLIVIIYAIKNIVAQFKILEDIKKKKKDI